MWWTPIIILIVGVGVLFLARKRHEEILTRWNYCRTNGIKWDWRKELRAAGLKCGEQEEEKLGRT